MVNKEKMKELDSHWQEVMNLAKQYGFLYITYGGTATLVIHEEQLKANGEEAYIERQKEMFGIDMRE